MTLILTIANARGVYQSSDYQLTDLKTGAPVSDRAGSKQLEAGFKTLQLELAFTGIASVPSGSSTRRTIDWLSQELKALPYDSGIEDICDVLAKRCTAAMKPHAVRGVLTLIVTFAVIGEPFRVAEISNADWRNRPPQARPRFSVDIRTIKKPFRLISGYHKSVPILQRFRLAALARATNKSPKEMLDALADINRIAAERSGGYVSEKCWVTSQVADGRIRRSAALNVGQQQGNIPQLLGGFDMAEWVKRNFRAAPGKEIGIVQSAGVIVGPGDAIPLPQPHGEPRRFKLSGSSVVGHLRSPSGEHCASLTVTQLDCVVRARRNEEVTVPFLEVVMRSVRPAGADFPRPLLPWPTLSPALLIDGAAVPRGREYSVGYWVEGGAHHVIIPETSGSIRNVAFLRDDDELVLVVPTRTAEFSWSRLEEEPRATLDARVWWRLR